MSKSVFAVLCVTALVAGCVSVTGPTASPALTPAATVAPTALPTVPPTTAPTATLAPSPTADGTEGPTVPPTAAPTGVPSAFDTRDVLFNDDLTDADGHCMAATTATPTDCFGVGEVTGANGTHIGSVSYQDGAFNFAVDIQNGWMWSRREVGGAHSTMRIAAEFIPATDGRFGLFCDSNDDELWGAVVGTDGSWVLGDIGETGINPLVTDENAGLPVPLGQSALMAVECAGLITGGLRLTLWMDRTGPVAIYETDHGPDNFDRAAAYAEATGTSTSIEVENIVAFGSGFDDNQVTDAAAELITHIPEDWVDSCYQSLRPPLFASVAEAVVTCFIGEPGDEGAEIAEYASYLSEEAMNAAYQQRVDTFGTGDQTDSCEEGSGERGYHFGSDDKAPEAGRLLCVDQFRGIRYDWTDNRLNILSALVDFDGDFSATFQNWVNGGPNV